MNFRAEFPQIKEGNKHTAKMIYFWKDLGGDLYAYKRISHMLHGVWVLLVAEKISLENCPRVYVLFCVIYGGEAAVYTNSMPSHFRPHNTITKTKNAHDASNTNSLSIERIPLDKPAARHTLTLPLPSVTSFNARPRVCSGRGIRETALPPDSLISRPHGTGSRASDELLESSAPPSATGST